MPSAEKRSTRSSTTPNKRAHDEIFEQNERTPTSRTYKRQKTTKPYLLDAGGDKGIPQPRGSSTNGSIKKGEEPRNREEKADGQAKLVAKTKAAFLQERSSSPAKLSNGVTPINSSPVLSSIERRSSGRQRRVSAKAAEAATPEVVIVRQRKVVQPPSVTRAVPETLKIPKQIQSEQRSLRRENGAHDGSIGGDEEDAQQTPTKKPRTNGKLRPRREHSILTTPRKKQSDVEIDVLRGILTPVSKRKFGTPKKSVAWTDSQLDSGQRSPSKLSVTNGVGLMEAAYDLQDELSAMADEDLMRNLPETIHEETLGEDEEDGALVNGHRYEVEGIDGDDESGISNNDLDRLKRQVLLQLAGHHRIPPVQLDTEYNTLHTLISQTIKAGESNSLLLLGGPGSGKNLLIDTVLGKLSSEAKSARNVQEEPEHGHSDVDEEAVEDYHVIRLDGRLQTDDKQALKEIWRQLGTQTIGEDEHAMQRDEERKNVADTMASLLALLTHNSTEPAPDAPVPHPPSDPTEPTPPPPAMTTSKALIFILDHFEAFTLHARQTLLYNLFDAAAFHPPGAPAVAVVGLSANLNVLDLLEKRVKSRFSHRTLFLRGAASLTEYWERVRGHLLVHDGDGSGGLEGVADSRGTVQERLRAAVTAGEEDSEPASPAARWNAALATLYPSNPSFAALLQRTQAHTSDPRRLFLSLLLPLTQSLHASHLVSPPRSMLTLKFRLGTALAAPATGIGNLALLTSLSSLALSLLIAAARLLDFHAHSHVTLSSTYAEYEALTVALRTSAVVNASLLLGSSAASPSGSRGGGVGVGAAGLGVGIGGSGGVSGAKLFGKQAARGSFEELVLAELLTPDAAGGGAGGDGLGMGRMSGGGRAEGEGRFRVEVGIEELGEVLEGMERRVLRGKGALGKGGGKRKGGLDVGGGDDDESDEEGEEGVGAVQRWMVRWCRSI